MRDTPATADELARALRTLDAAGPAPSRAVAAHLALPVTSTVTTDVDLYVEVVAWRGQRADVAEDASIDDLAAAAVALAEAGRRPGDRYLDLAGSRYGWVKPARSGTRIVFYGADLVAGANIGVDPDGFDDDTLEALAAQPARLVEAVSAMPESGPVSVPGLGTVLVDASPGLRLVTSPSRRGAGVGPDVALEAVLVDVVDSVAASLGTTEVAVLRPGTPVDGRLSVDLRATVDGRAVDVPVVVDARGGALVGVPRETVIAGTPRRPVPDSLRFDGIDAFTGRDVLRAADGLRVLA